jgi:hypothetical protein
MLEMTSINIFGITILEPVATLTDILVAAVCFYAFINLRNHPNKKAIYILLYRYYFLIMGFATLYGGIIGHGLLYMFSFEWKIPGWILSMISVGLIERASIFHAKSFLKKNVGKFFAWFNLVELATLIFIAIYTLKFIFVEAHGAYGFLIVLSSFELVVYIKTKDKGSKLALWAVFFAFLAAVSHIAKLSIHKWFNHIDLAHVFMIIGSLLLFYAVKAMRVHSVEIDVTSKKVKTNIQ